MLSLQARLTKADREEHRWSSAGNTKVTRNRQGKVTNVSFGFTITSHYIVDSVGKQHDSIIFHVLQCPWVLWFPRSGGPKLKETQSYPSKFCSRVCSLHKTWCLETWLNLEFI